MELVKIILEVWKWFEEEKNFESDFEIILRKNLKIFKFENDLRKKNKRFDCLRLFWERF